MFIDTTYFVGEILIPNLTGVSPVIAGNVEEVTRFIKKYEPDYLLNVLGEELYDALKTGLAANPIEAKWTVLKNKFINADIPASPIAGYVYFHVMRDRFTTTTALGEVENAAENSINALNSYKIASAYNEAVREGKKIRSWLSENTSTYPEFASAGSYSLRPVNIFGV
jgi:hypothetical protein